jgi:hypothetical protein
MATRNVTGTTASILAATNTAGISPRTVTGLIETITLTETASSVVKVRPVICSTEAVTITEAAGNINRTLNFTTTTEVAGLITANSCTIYRPSRIEETFTVSDDAIWVLNLTVTETFEASDDVTPLGEVALVTESFTADDTVTVPSSTYTITETFEAKDVVTFSHDIYIQESATVSDEVTFSRTLSVVDAFTADSSVTPSNTATATITETFDASDEVTPIYLKTITETFEANDTVTPSNSATATITETANANSTVELQKVCNDTITETCTWDDTIDAAGSVYTVTVSSTANVTDAIWAPDYLAVAWVLNTETGGLCYYDNYGFDSIAAHDGVIYATSPNGVYELSGDNDAGRNINSRLKTGFLDFDTEHLKRIAALYVGYTGGALKCSVEAYTSDANEVYTYDMEERTAGAPRNNRIKTGKGVASRYWRFDFENVEGADFQIQDIAVELGISNRRL